MSNIKARAGKVSIRVGGNTQETAVLIPEGFDTGYVIQKTRRPGSTPVSFFHRVKIHARIAAHYSFPRIDRDAPDLLLARADLFHEKRFVPHSN